MTTKQLALRRADTCAVCQVALAVGTEAIWDSEVRTVTCIACAHGTSESVAGHSARAHGQDLRNRQLARRAQLKADRPVVGRLAIALAGPPTDGQSWLVGAAGEEALGRSLDLLHHQGVLFLHDRRIPRSKANIDHIAVTGTGVWAIDAKQYTGSVRVVNKGSIFRSDWRLTVNGRDRSKLVTGVLKQIAHLRAALAAADPEVVVRGALCFTDSDWPLLARPEQLDGVVIAWAKALKKQLVAEGPIDVAHRHRIANVLDQVFRPA